MEREIRISTTNLIDVLKECFAYVVETCSYEKGERELYMSELETVMDMNEEKGGIFAFEYLISTHIFRSAIGKIVEATENTVVVVTKY